MQTLINFLIKQLEPLANEDKDEHIRLLEAKLAEKGKPASSSGLPVVGSPSMAQPINVVGLLSRVILQSIFSI